MGVMKYMALKNRIEEVYGILIERVAVLEAEEFARQEAERAEAERRRKKWWKFWG